MGPVGRRLLVGLAVARYAIPIAAIAAAPALIPDDVGLLMLLRPAKEVILLAGGLTNTDATPGVALSFLAYLPLMVAAIWIYFAIGRVWGPALENGTAPELVTRVLPPQRVKRIHAVLEARGPTMAILGRLAGLPPTIVAAAAGTSRTAASRFLVADAIGAIASFTMVFGIGFLLGDAWERGGLPLTVASVALVVVAYALVNRWVRQELELNGT